MLSVKAVIFDMYQTLVANPEEGWFNLFKEIHDARKKAATKLLSKLLCDFFRSLFQAERKAAMLNDGVLGSHVWL